MNKCQKNLKPTRLITLVSKTRNSAIQTGIKANHFIHHTAALHIPTQDRNPWLNPISVSFIAAITWPE